MDLETAKHLVSSINHWHHRFEIYPGIVTPGTYDPEFLLAKIDFPVDMKGMRVLDIGPSDGFFSLFAYRRGAEVVAVDYRPKDAHGFGIMEKITGAQFEYRCANIYDLSAAELGTFDHVLFLGVLYHLPDMVKALSIVRSLAKGHMYLESHVANEIGNDLPLARYYKKSDLAGDITNFWSPNNSCIRSMAEDCAFSLIEDENWGDRYFGKYLANQDSDSVYKLKIAYGVF